jgi:hypothetical protein
MGLKRLRRLSIVASNTSSSQHRRYVQNETPDEIVGPIYPQRDIHHVHLRGYSLFLDMGRKVKLDPRRYIKPASSC